MASRSVQGRASVLYRVRRFVGRHKAGVLATATVALVLVISLFIVVEQVNESQRQLARANAVAKFMSDILKAPSNRWSSTFRIGVDATMQETLLAAAASLQQDSELPVATRVELLVALSESLSIWGLRDQAVQFAREATEMADAGLAPSHPMRELSYINMSIVSNIRGSPESLAEAPRFAQASIDWLQKYDPTNYARLASSVGDLGYNKSQLGEHAQAIVFYEQGFEYWEASGGPDVHPLRALALGLLGYSAFEVGDYDKAYTALDGSFEVYEALGGSPIAEWTITYPYLALLNMAMGRYARAEHVMLRGIEMSDRDGSDDAQKYRSLALYGLMFRQLNRATLVRAVEQRMTQAPARVNEDVLFVLCRQLSQAMDLIERGESAQAFSLLSELADQGVDQAPWYLYVSHLTLLRPLVNASDERSLIEDTLRQLIAEHRLQDAFFTRHFRRADS